MGKETRFVKVKTKIPTKEDVTVVDKINDVELNNFLLRKINKTNDFLLKATMMHETLLESLS